MKSEMLENLEAFLDSPDGKKRTEEYFRKIKNGEDMEQSQVERFWSKYKDDLDSVIEKITSKYGSEKYKDSWYNRGIEPQESLYYFLYNVAKVFGREFTQSEYDAKENTMFTADVYVLGNWTIELIVGQGSAILIDKIK